MKQTSNVPFSKVDTKLFVDGLFVPTKGKARGKLLTEPLKMGDTKVQYQGFDQLGTDDQSILLAICANLGIDGLIIKPADPKGPYARQLVMDIEFEEYTGFPPDNRRNMVSKKTTYYNILKMAGFKNPHATKDLRVILNRLGNVQARYMSKKWDYAVNLLKHAYNKINGEVYIAVNPEITRAILGEQHALVSLYERRELETETAKLLHFWLSGYVRPGGCLGRNGARLEKLCRHVWGPKHDGVDRRLKSRRKGYIREALNQIADNTQHLYLNGGVSWKIEYDREIAKVERPAELPFLEEIERTLNDTLESDF